MNRTLVVHLLRQRLTSPARLTFLLLLGGAPLLGLLLVPAIGLASLGTAIAFVLVFGAGMIGQDVSSGVLPLVLARPVRRSEYVLSRWAAVALGAAAAALVQLALAVNILVLRGTPPRLVDVLGLLVTHLVVVVAGAAAMTLLSALVHGLFDLGLWVMIAIGSQIAQSIGAGTRTAWLVRVASELERFISPALDPAGLLGRGPFPWSDALTIASNVAIALAIAIAVVSRRELSYASG